MSDSAEFNINDEVWVKLTELGRNELRKQSIEFEREYPQQKDPPRIAFEHYLPEEDADGWSKWKLWELMGKFGWLLRFSGMNCPFEPTIRLKPPGESTAT